MECGRWLHLHPEPGFTGTDGFTYALSDGRFGTTAVRVTLTVAPRAEPDDDPDGDWPRPFVVTGGPGNERLSGTYLPDSIQGMDGSDTITGDGGRDQLNGNAGDDLVMGDGDEDVVWGGLGRDRVLGGPGNDWVLGDRGDDTVQGGQGNDHAWGGQGDDIVLGERGRDVLDGGQGDDTLAGGADDDLLRGGAGNDCFVYRAGDGLDRILDFDAAGGDVIRLEVGPGGLLDGVPIGGFDDIADRLFDIPGGVLLSLDGQGIVIEG